MDLEPNTIMKHWRVGKQIGKGGFSSVYDAEQLDGTMKGKFVLKLLSVAVGGENREHMIEEEVRILRNLRSLKSFPRLVEYFSFQNFKCIVLTKEYADLHVLLEKNPKKCFEKVTVQKLAYKLLENLRALHELGIMHRDIKKENICMRDTSENAEVVIIDFGLAREFRDSAGVRLPPKRDDDNQMDELLYSSIDVLETNTSSETDDLIQACYILAEMRGLDSLCGDNDPDRNMDKKFKLKYDPYNCFPENHLFLAELFEIVHAQQRFHTPDYNAILETVKGMVPGFDADRPWEWEWGDGMLTLV